MVKYSFELDTYLRSMKNLSNQFEDIELLCYQCGSNQYSFATMKKTTRQIKIKCKICKAENKFSSSKDQEIYYKHMNKEVRSNDKENK